MRPDTPSEAEELVDLSAVVGGMAEELRCLLGPAIHLATSGLPTSGRACVRVRHEDIEDLLRHLALDTHDAMPAGGRSTIRTGDLHELAGPSRRRVRDARS